MNKYKMISICSFTIVCVLIMSLLLPIKTTANDKESLEINMHYAESKVTLDITVNSDVYTGVVCKYLMLDDVLVEEDLVTKTKENGTTINIDKTENDKYNTIIKDVNKRYVVVYVSIGNCSLCDYIDCQPNAEENKEDNNQNVAPSDGQGEHNLGVEGNGANGEQPTENKEQNKTEQPTENKEQNKTEQPAENKEENKTEQPTENKEQNKTEQPAESKEENKTEKPAENKEENKTQQTANNNGTTNKTQQQTSQNVNKSNSNGINLNNYDKNTSTLSNGNSNVPVSGDKDSINVSKPASGDKDAIDTSDFQEIEKTATTSTADGNMPKTGEDDFIKILGIVVFSALSIVSFYKYQTTK